MTNEFELSRRKALAALGTIGVASAGAGLGTSAYFSDQETFESNQLTAGELDLKVDWEEHYSDWSDDEANLDDDNDENDLDIVMEDPEDSAYVGLPDPASPLIWVHEDDLDAFMDNTSIEAFPDFDGDGTQDADSVDPVYVPCEDGADTPDDLDPTTGLRTNNDDTYGDGAPLPLVNLSDVKPGDFGELTLSFHLCDNPGYVWLQADNVSEAENGVNEAEASDDDEDAGGQFPDDTPEDQIPGEPELAEEIQTVWWYDDDGDNVLDETVGDVNVVVALDRSGSLNADEYDALEAAGNSLVDDLLGAGAHVGGVTFGDSNGVDIVSGLGTADFDFPTSTPSSSNNTPMPAALDVADQLLDDYVANDPAEQVIVLLTDGGPNYANQVYTADGLEAPRANDWSADSADQAYDSASGSGSVTVGELDETELVADNIKDPAGTDTGDASRIVTVGIGDPELVNGTSLDDYLRDRVATSPANHYNATFSNLADIVDDVFTGVVLSEQVIHRGNLRDDLDSLSQGQGLPLDGNLTTDYDEIGGIDNETADELGERECFQPSTTHYIGFAWWLPVDHGNEVQSDSVSFDLGFYTEQCRHNDGDGLTSEPVENPT